MERAQDSATKMPGKLTIETIGGDLPTEADIESCGDDDDRDGSASEGEPAKLEKKKKSVQEVIKGDEDVDLGTEKIHNILDFRKIVKNKKEEDIGVQTLRILKTCKVCTPMFPSFLFFIIFCFSLISDPQTSS